MKKTIRILTIAICIVVLISLVPVSAKDIREKPQGVGGPVIKIVAPPTNAEATAALGTATIKAAAVSSAATIPVLKTPTLVSPTNGIMLYSYPRTTLLVWKPVDGATGYLVDRAYYDSGGTWHFYPTVTVTGNTNTFYQFNFVGDQEGCWRVTAIGDSTHANSNPSAFRTFSYDTLNVLAQPKPVSPANSIVFYHFPRTTELMWKPVPGANAYKIERQYCTSGISPCPAGSWISYPDAQVDGVLNTDYTFNFVGAQEGRWRVTAIDTSGTFFTSSPSVWRNFTYKF